MGGKRSVAESRRQMCTVVLSVGSRLFQGRVRERDLEDVGPWEQMLPRALRARHWGVSPKDCGDVTVVWR